MVEVFVQRPRTTMASARPLQTLRRFRICGKQNGLRCAARSGHVPENEPQTPSLTWHAVVLSPSLRAKC